jgi:hypothetical protein
MAPSNKDSTKVKEYTFAVDTHIEADFRKAKKMV